MDSVAGKTNRDIESLIGWEKSVLLLFISGHPGSDFTRDGKRKKKKKKKRKLDPACEFVLLAPSPPTVPQLSSKYYFYCSKFLKKKCEM